MQMTNETYKQVGKNINIRHNEKIKQKCKNYTKGNWCLKNAGVICANTPAPERRTRPWSLSKYNK